MHFHALDRRSVVAIRWAVSLGCLVGCGALAGCQLDDTESPGDPAGPSQVAAAGSSPDTAGPATPAGSPGTSSADPGATGNPGGGSAEPSGPGESPGGATTGCLALADRVKVTAIKVGVPLIANDEYHPVLLSPIPSGGSRVAWREKPKMAIHVMTLDARDRQLSEWTSFPGEEVHALVAHDDGGAMIVVENDPDIYSSKYCRGPSTPDKPYCAKVDLVRFDGAGKTAWRMTLTSKTNVDSNGANFVWWYQHTARLVWAEGKYGAYFRNAGSSPRPGVAGEVDIHAGDNFKFVGATGNLVAGGWDWGCSHSWAIRVAYNGHWGAACHGDAYPNAFRLLVMDPGKTLSAPLLHDRVDPTKRTLGGLVGRSDGFWLSHTAPESNSTDSNDVHLALVKNDGTVQDEILRSTPGVSEIQSRLADYGPGRMLVGWKANDELSIAVLDKSNGQLIDGPVQITARIDDFADFVAFPNGDVAWAFSPGDSTDLSVVRILACKGPGP